LIHSAFLLDITNSNLLYDFDISRICSAEYQFNSLDKLALQGTAGFKKIWVYILNENVLSSIRKTRFSRSLIRTVYRFVVWIHCTGELVPMSDC